MSSVDMILCFKKIRANTIFAKKEFQISFHYASQTREFLKSEGIVYVPLDQNAPNAPQIRPNDNFFGISKQHVYADNWSTTS